MRRALLTATMLCGCATCPLPPVALPVQSAYRPERPTLPIATLRPDDAPDVVARAYKMTIEILKGYAEQLEALRP